MASKKIKIQELIVDPYFVPPSELNFPILCSDGLLLYKVHAGKKLYSKGTYPFRPSDDLITRQISLKEPIYAGVEYWFARQVMTYVMWFGAYIIYRDSIRLRNTAHGPILSIPSQRYFLFDTEQYTDTLTQTYQTYRYAWDDIPKPDDYTFPETIPHLSQSELFVIVSSMLNIGYEEQFLYCDPHNINDKTGAKYYRHLYQGLQDDPKLEVCHPPEQVIKLTFGVDGRSAYEFHWFVGQVSNGIAIQFAKNKYPKDYFPLWVTGNAITQALKPLFSA